MTVFRKIAVMILLPALLGGLLQGCEWYAWMSFRYFGVSAATYALERRFWDVFPSRVLRFWPLFVGESGSLRAFLERTLPVTVDVEMTGFGAFEVDIRWLSPLMLVEWNGRVWCVSRENRMWDAGERQPGLRLPEKPLWRFAWIGTESERALGVAGAGRTPSGVFPSVFPIEPVEAFMVNFGGESWFSDVTEVYADRVAGEDVFRLRLVRGRQEIVVSVQNRGGEFGEVLGRLLESLFREGGSHFVDATYRNKIVVSGAGTDAERTR
ncbi:MAG: hypothetical protein LBR38_08950 [Synergistaceae bacterium]|jgi:hypothetical protein|nr:hypothetical protein [Synergistaceae bacterium]